MGKKSIQKRNILLEYNSVIVGIEQEAGRAIERTLLFLLCRINTNKDFR